MRRRILVTSRSRIAELEDALSDCKSLQRIILVEDEEALRHGGGIACESLRQFVEREDAGEFTWARGADTDMVGILYTSGSTGEPKGVMLSHRNFVARAKCVSEYLNLTADDRILNLPHYSFGFGLDQLFNGFHAGACSVLHNYVTPQALMKTLADEGITGVAGVPTALAALTTLDWPEEVRENVRYIAAAGGRMPESATRALRCLAHDADIYLMYGQTETLRSTFLAPEEVDDYPNSMGRAISVRKSMWCGLTERFAVRTNRVNLCKPAIPWPWLTGTMPNARPRSSGPRRWHLPGPNRTLGSGPAIS